MPSFLRFKVRYLILLVVAATTGFLACNARTPTPARATRAPVVADDWFRCVPEPPGWLVLRGRGPLFVAVRGGGRTMGTYTGSGDTVQVHLDPSWRGVPDLEIQVGPAFGPPNVGRRDNGPGARDVLVRERVHPTLSLQYLGRGGWQSFELDCTVADACNPRQCPPLVADPQDFDIRPERVVWPSDAGVPVPPEDAGP